MSIRLVPLAVASLALGAVVVPARAEVSVQKECGAEYQAAKTAGSLNGQTWQQFLQECRTRHAAPGAAAAPAPAPAEAPAAAPAAPAAAPAEAHVSVQKECGSEYQAAKAAGSLSGQTWQQFLQACRARHGAAPAAAAPAAPAPAPAPVAAPAAPAPAPAAPSGPNRRAGRSRQACRRSRRRSARRRRDHEDRQALEPRNTGVHRARESVRRRVARQEGCAPKGQSQGDLAFLPQRMQQAAEGPGTLRVKRRPPPSPSPALREREVAGVTQNFNEARNPTPFDARNPTPSPAKRGRAGEGASPQRPSSTAQVITTFTALSGSSLPKQRW